MSKEGLEALENIGFEPLYQNEDGSYWRVRDENKEDFEIIEKELKALEIILDRVPLNLIRSYLEKEEKDLLREVL